MTILLAGRDQPRGAGQEWLLNWPTGDRRPCCDLSDTLRLFSVPDMGTPHPSLRSLIRFVRDRPHERCPVSQLDNHSGRCAVAKKQLWQIATSPKGQAALCL